MGSNIHSANPVVRSLIEGAAPRPAQLAASRGILPLPQADLFEVLVSFATSNDPELSANAKAAFAEQSQSDLDAAVRSGNAAPIVLGFVAEMPSVSMQTAESIVANPLTPAESLICLAKQTEQGPILELLALNQQLLIQNPKLIDAIIDNPNRTAEAARRATETRSEFFEKERGAQQIVNELRAQGNEAAAEFIENSEFAEDMDAAGISDEDALFFAKHIEVLDRETDDSWMSLEFIEEIYEETEEQRRAVYEKILGDLSSEDDESASDRISMLNRIIKMGVKDRVKLGMKGDREARNILIRDPNKLVASAVINNPKITEQEVERIATMRSVPEEVLRQIATNRQWQRSYLIQLCLAKNPRTPLGNSMAIMNRLQLRDLIGLQKDRNVPEAVRKHAQRLVNARTGGKS